VDRSETGDGEIKGTLSEQSNLDQKHPKENLKVPGLHIYTFSIDQPSKVQMCKPGTLFAVATPTEMAILDSGIGLRPRRAF
jgi:hypothetical protein